MPENYSESVAIIFRKGPHFLVPPEPLQLPYEPRQNNEDFEHAAYRLAIDHGVRQVHFDRPLVIPKAEGFPGSAYVFTDTLGQLDSSEHFVHEIELRDHVAEHSSLRPVDKMLFDIALDRYQSTRIRQFAKIGANLL